MWKQLLRPSEVGYATRRQHRERRRRTDAINSAAGWRRHTDVTTHTHTHADLCGPSSYPYLTGDNASLPLRSWQPPRLRRRRPVDRGVGATAVQLFR